MSLHTLRPPAGSESDDSPFPSAYPPAPPLDNDRGEGSLATWTYYAVLWLVPPLGRHLLYAQKRYVCRDGCYWLLYLWREGEAGMGSAVVCDLDWATECATAYLAPLGLRWLHVQSVAAKARQVARMFDRNDCCDLIAAAYLHDIGYAPVLARTGFHPLDGACYLRSLGYERLACLVAHHPEARFEAELRDSAPLLSRFRASGRLLRMR
jgi:hypothetical protein